MSDVRSALKSLLKDTAAYLEYASLSGLDLAPYSAPRSKACDESIECTACPFQSDRAGLFRGWGGEHAKLAFVSATPPPCAENGEYNPFTGRVGEQTGKIIKAAKNVADLEDEDISLFFVTECIPPQGTSPDTLKDAYRSCAPLLEKKIKAQGPLVVVAMGEVAFRALTGSSDIEGSRGKFSLFNDIKVIPTYGIKELIGDRTLRRPVWEDILLALGALKD